MADASRLVDRKYERLVGRIPEQEYRNIFLKAAAKYPDIKHDLVYLGSGSIEPTEIDYAMLAAYIDGEGCIAINQAKTRNEKRPCWVLSLGVANGDPRLMEWLTQRWGGYISENEIGGNVHFTWTAPWPARMRILESCRKYMVIKQEQCLIALNLLILQSKNTGCRGDSQETREKKRELCEAIQGLHRVRVKPEDLVAPFQMEVGYVQ